jgi:hypothetical protein
VTPDPVAAIRREAEADRAAGVTFILETRQGVPFVAVERAVRDRLGVSCVVEPLFRTSSGALGAVRLETFFLARLPGLRFADLPHSPYDWAYALRGPETLFRTVEPDTTFYLHLPLGPPGLESLPPPCFHDDAPGWDLPKRWSLDAVAAPEAWGLSPPQGGTAMGDGVRVAHLDTGRATHAALPEDAFDAAGEYDFIGNKASALDPLGYTLSAGLYPELPGHGTATGSVVAGRGDAVTLVQGVAPRARLVPVRCVRSVLVSATASAVARAIQHAVGTGCHVISVSLGGLPRRALQRAVSYALERSLIVCAAAGNCVGYVIAPALYDACVAVAGVDRESRPWIGSCSGGAVDVSAPGQFVWGATPKPDDNPTDRPYQGTSFAVAHVAGAAACWLAYHGRQALLDRYANPGSMQAIFQDLVMRTAVRPERWDRANFGAGILNVRDLLAAPLPESEAVSSPIREETYFELLVAAVGSDQAGRLLRTSGGRTGFESTAAAEPVGAELLDLLYQAGRGRPVGGSESVRACAGEILERVRAFGSWELRRAIGG